MAKHLRKLGTWRYSSTTQYSSYWFQIAPPPPPPSNFFPSLSYEFNSDGCPSSFQVWRHGKTKNLHYITHTATFLICVFSTSLRVCGWLNILGVVFTKKKKKKIVTETTSIILSMTRNLENLYWDSDTDLFAETKS